MFKRLRSYQVQRPLARVSAALVLFCAFGPVTAEEKKSDKAAEKKAPANPEKGERPQPVEAQYKLKPGDVLSVTVSPQTGFDCTGLVLPDGLLYLKNIGEIKAGGMTGPELRLHVRKVLDKELLEPEVSVVMTQLGPEHKPEPIKIGKITV